MHPLGKSPVITDDDVTAAESGAISEYLVERHGGGKLRPGSNTPARLRYTYRLHFAERSAMPPLLVSLIFSRSPKQPMAFFAKPIARAIGTNVKAAYVDPNIDRQMDFMESELAQRAWIAGKDFSAADIQMSFPLEAAAARGLLRAAQIKPLEFPHADPRGPAYQRAVARGGQFSPESSRERDPTP